MHRASKGKPTASDEPVGGEAGERRNSPITQKLAAATDSSYSTKGFNREGGMPSALKLSFW